MLGQTCRGDEQFAGQGQWRDGVLVNQGRQAAWQRDNKKSEIHSCYLREIAFLSQQDDNF